MATLIVEDGTIVAGANTYVSELDAVEYLQTYSPIGDQFEAYDQNEFQLALIQATQAVDALYGQHYLGVIRTDGQPLLYPRGSLYDNNGRYRSENTIPFELKAAVSELAAIGYNGTDLMEFTVNAAQFVLSRSVSVAGAVSKSETYSKSVPQEMYTGLRRVERLLTPIIEIKRRVNGIKL